eukprot:scaffold3646_cov257-Chaetoceros_neogracile.AAC.22
MAVVLSLDVECQNRYPMLNFVDTAPIGPMLNNIGPMLNNIGPMLNNIGPIFVRSKEGRKEGGGAPSANQKVRQPFPSSMLNDDSSYIKSYNI